MSSISKKEALSFSKSLIVDFKAERTLKIAAVYAIPLPSS
jgi:hypothetical protein